MSRINYSRTVPAGHPFVALGREFVLFEPVQVEVKSDVGDTGGWTAELSERSVSSVFPGVFTPPCESSESAVDALLSSMLEKHPNIMPAYQAGTTPPARSPDGALMRAP